MMQRTSIHIVFLALLIGFTVTLGVFSDALASDSVAACKQPRIDVTGSFDSNYGLVHLEQSGDRVVGTYECCGGGRIVGTLTGSTINYEWQQPGASGRGRWEVVDRGEKLLGTWGSGDSRDSGGAWDLERKHQTTSTSAIIVAR